MRISVPAGIDCVASGELEPGFPGILPGKEPALNRKIYVFTAAQPLRYLAFILSRFSRAETATLGFPGDADPGISGKTYRALNLSVEANPRQVQRGRELAERAADIALFYESLIGDSPYSSFTVAVVESDLPGGHSPGYFAMLNQPLPRRRSCGATIRRRSPAIPTSSSRTRSRISGGDRRSAGATTTSSGSARASRSISRRSTPQHQKGDETFVSMLRQLRKWAIDASDQGPVYLGYRLGHIRGDSRVFRALVYNKGAAVLHMLRRLVGDDAFFRGLRRFYRDSRFRKVGTDDFRVAMEEESGKKLGRFFERWIYGSTLPKLKVGYRIDGADVVLRVEQIGEVFDVPVTVTLQYSDRKSVDVLIPVTEQSVDRVWRRRGSQASGQKDVGTLRIGGYAVSKEEGDRGRWPERRG